MSLTDYLLRYVSDLARRPSMEEVLDRARALSAVSLGEDSATAVRAERDAR